MLKQYNSGAIYNNGNNMVVNNSCGSFLLFRPVYLVDKFLLIRLRSLHLPSARIKQPSLPSRSAIGAVIPAHEVVPLRRDRPSKGDLLLY